MKLVGAYWVMRVTPLAMDSSQGCVVNGEWVLPVRDFPLDAFDHQNDAQEAAVIFAQREHARTGDVHKIVLNADVEV